MTSSSRNLILGRLRQHLLPALELPALDDNWIQYPDPVQQFSNVLEQVGGKCVAVQSLADVSQYLETLSTYANAKIRVSLVPGAGNSTLDLNTTDDPHLLEDVDFALLPGQIAVAENAAVWVDDAAIRQRVVYFITQHLALVVPRSGLVDNLHAAYDRISVARRPFGAFISGPSKTADIEQSLVIGAHGSRSMTVFLVADLPDLNL